MRVAVKQPLLVVTSVKLDRYRARTVVRITRLDLGELGDTNGSCILWVMVVAELVLLALCLRTRARESAAELSETRSRYLRKHVEARELRRW